MSRDRFDDWGENSDRWEDKACDDPECCFPKVKASKTVVPVEDGSSPIFFEVEVDFDEDVEGAKSLYLSSVEIVYIEKGEIRLVRGPLAQVIELDDIKFLMIRAKV